MLLPSYLDHIFLKPDKNADGDRLQNKDPDFLSDSDYTKEAETQRSIRKLCILSKLSTCVFGRQSRHLFCAGESANCLDKNTRGQCVNKRDDDVGIDLEQSMRLKLIM